MCFFFFGSDMSCAMCRSGFFHSISHLLPSSVIHLSRIHYYYLHFNHESFLRKTCIRWSSYVNVAENRVCLMVSLVDNNNRTLYPKEEAMYPWHYLKDWWMYVCTMYNILFFLFFSVCVSKGDIVNFAVQTALEIILKCLELVKLGVHNNNKLFQFQCCAIASSHQNFIVFFHQHLYVTFKINFLISHKRGLGLALVVAVYLPIIYSIFFFFSRNVQ